MPQVDVAVIGAGLSGLSAAVELAEAGASVMLVGKGYAATHWMHGALDVAAPPGAATSREGVGQLSQQPGHPYALLAGDLEPALDAQLERLAAAGLPYRGGLDDPLAPMPTAIGGVRPVAILPEAQAAAISPWGSDEGLVVIGIARFKDSWAPFMADTLRRTWRESPRPSEIAARVVALPRLERLRNLTPLDVARLFDAEPAWRRQAIQAIAAAVPSSGRWRLAVPAVLGLRRHAEVFEEVAGGVGHPVFEVATVPPSLPGMRLRQALSERLAVSGGRLQIGSPVVRVEREHQRVRAVHTEGAARTYRTTARHFVLATGGIAGGGIRVEPDGSLRETVLDLPVLAPPRSEWFSSDFSPAGHPLETAGVRVDSALRPTDQAGEPLLENVHVAGSLLAGMRYLGERCGDGAALASAHRAAREVTAAGLAGAA